MAESALLADAVERERRSADEPPPLDVVADGRADTLADIA
jgi:hypothetical protein